MPSQPFPGVLVPVLTPFTPQGEPDAGRFVAFCRWLLDQGAGGLAIFGTTSEANSMSAGERMALLDRLIAAGIPAAKLMPGDRRLLDDRGGDAGPARCRPWLRRRPDAAALLLQGSADDGVFAFIAGVIDRVASPALKMYLYHIPPQAVVGYSLDLVGRLIKAYPETVVGLKDSSGDWSNTAALLDRYPRLCRLPGLRGVSARRAAQGWGRLHHRLGQRQRAGHPQGLRELADAAGRRVAGRDHDRAQDHPGLSDGAGVEADRRAFPRRPRLGGGAPADGGARPRRNRRRLLADLAKIGFTLGERTPAEGR